MHKGFFISNCNAEIYVFTQKEDVPFFLFYTTQHFYNNDLPD